MKYTTRIPYDYPDEYKQEYYQKERELFAIKLLDFLEQQTYPLLIFSFDEGSKQEYKHLDKFDGRMQNLLYDEYT